MITLSSRSPKKMPNVSVVIPYYQTNESLLSRALQSIFNQSSRFNINVVIVDDSSPYPCDKVLSKIKIPANIRIIVDKQKNQGAAIARNRGLDLAPPETEYLAFLDSDDYWMPDHLERAINSLEKGYNLYFSSKLEEDEENDLFKRRSFIRLVKHQSVSINGMEYKTIADDLQKAVILGFLITSTIVYRFKKFYTIRFPTDFYRFGEDQFFCLLLQNEGDRFIFSEQVGAIYGRGVSIYSQKSFGTDKDLLRIKDEIAFRRLALKCSFLNKEPRTLMVERLRKARHSMSVTILHRIRRGKTKYLLPTIFSDTALLFYIAKNAVSKGLKPLKR